MPTAITANGPLDADVILAEDLAFHLGDRSQFELKSMDDVAASVPAPDDVFLCLQLEPARFLSGEFYKKHCRIGAERLELDEAEATGKHKRAVAVINRDFSLLGRDTPYAYSMRDGRQYDYAAIFGTARPIPVFQYYRRRGLAAIVHPLPGFHTFPSPMIPDAGDTLAFGEKTAKVFWRGGLSGRVQWANGYTGSKKVLAETSLGDDEKAKILRRIPRFAICQDFAGSDAVDVGLVFRDGDDVVARGTPFLERLAKPRASVSDHLRYRYLLALDGNDYPSSFYWMLNTNSVVLRPQSPWEAFGDNYFLPWIHFVPFRADGSDLIEKFNWCEANRAECERISANARRAWSVLFEPRYQLKRRKAVLAGYREWFARS